MFKRRLWIILTKRILLQKNFWKCVRMCEISHVRTPARVQNVCNVHGLAARVYFCKNIFGNVCGCAYVRNFARPHTRTRAKCVQRPWFGCRRLFLQKNFWKCVRMCEFARPHTRTHAKCVQFVSKCKWVQADAIGWDLTFTHTMF